MKNAAIYPPAADEFLTVQGAAALLGVTVATIYRWRYEHRIPYRKHGRLVRFSKADLLAWSKNSEVVPDHDRAV